MLRRPGRGLRTGVCEKRHASGEEENTREDKLSEHKIRGRRAMFAAGLYGRGSRKRSDFFTDTGMTPFVLSRPTTVTAAPPAENERRRGVRTHRVRPYLDSFTTGSGQVGLSQKCRDFSQW